jgi:uncharacterized membrane protein
MLLFLPPPSFSPDHLHPILVNFTAALVPASVGSDLLGRLLRKPSLHQAAWWMLIYAAAITPLTGLAGFWWKKQLGDALPPEIVLRHQWLGIGLAVSLLPLLAWRWRISRNHSEPGGAYLSVALALVAALVVQGSLGGLLLFVH